MKDAGQSEPCESIGTKYLLLHMQDTMRLANLGMVGGKEALI